MGTGERSKSTARARLQRRARPLRLALALAVLGTAASAWLVAPFWRLSAQLGDRSVTAPSRVFSRGLELRVGSSPGRSSIERELRALGYRDGVVEGPGTLQSGETRTRIHVRRSATPEGWRAAGVLDLEFDRRGAVQVLRWRDLPVERFELDGPVIGTFYGSDRQDRYPVEVDDLPEHLTRAVLAAEDSRFFEHSGLSARGIVRAAWVNLRRGALSQGGSTLTQQLVKNLFLTHEKTFSRKAREAILAVFVDWRYSKRSILNAYLNEIYWGQKDGVSLMGVGAASAAYFGKEASELDICEAALLAGLIRSPGGYAPDQHPERAVERRNWVVGRMVEEGWLERSTADAVVASPLCVNPSSAKPTAAPYFVDLVRRETSSRFGFDPAETGGLTVLSTLRASDQRRAEEALLWGVKALEEGWQEDHRGSGPLQAAVVSLDPRSGGILSYIGGRSYPESQFDRASQAARQPGSAFKPVVYATAFERRVATPATLILDGPLTVAFASTTWSPRNSDGDFRGWVTARSALERSLNVPTARLALATGLQNVVDTARALGVRTRLEAVPALALGAFEVAPLDLAVVYASLASGGVRREPHSVLGVLSADGRQVEGRSLAPAERVLSAESAYVVTSILQGVLETGTASSARTLGIQDPVAGKTGTTNDRRDSWFAGYSPDRATLVWVGYDDNSATRLSGARAALPIWARFAASVRPHAGFDLFDVPSGVTTAAIDPVTGLLATDACEAVQIEVFTVGEAPRKVCSLHGRPWRRWKARGIDDAGLESLEQARRGWLRRLFSRKAKKADGNGL